MKIYTFRASDYAKLDSDVWRGGGTDDTDALQALLDYAQSDGCGVHLILDGAALIRTLRLYSDTVIECTTKSCGFFQMEHTNRSMICAGDAEDASVTCRNISILGGTYNQNGKYQTHEQDFQTKQSFYAPAARGYDGHCTQGTYGLEFFNVSFLTLRDVTVRNFRTYAVAVGGFYHVTLEDVWLERPDGTDAENQDGFHFWGPGQFLTVRNCGGNVGDDFINVGPDERDRESSITDVLIDGLFLDHADQAVRLLSRYNGRLDRITIRNISGHYKSFGFFIDPWFVDEKPGNFGHIFIENVDLQALQPNYNYRKNSLFSIGGNIESLVLKNIRHHNSYDNRELIEIGYPYASPKDEESFALFGQQQKIRHILVEDLLVVENEQDPTGTDYIGVHAHVENLVIRNASIYKENGVSGSLVRVFDESTASIDRLWIENADTPFTNPVVAPEGSIQKKRID